MKHPRSILLALAGLTLSAGGAEAQLGAGDAWVLPWGMLSAGAGTSFAHADALFGTDWSDLLGPLDQDDFLPLSTLRTRIDEFLVATGGPVAGDEALRLGGADLRIGTDTRVVPMGISAGILPRLELELTVPIHRSEIAVRRFAFSDGNVGANPDPAGNAAAFAQIDPDFESLGSSPLLPLAESPLGRHLSGRAEERGIVITLPQDAAGADAAVNALLVQELGISPIAGELRAWRIGDAEAALKVRLLGNMGDEAFPVGDAPFSFRTAASARIRIPLTESQAATVRLIDVSPASGVSGWGGGVAADVFFGQVFWLSASTDYSAPGEVDVQRRVADPDRPLATAEPTRTVRWSPPSETRIRISPRVRLERAIAIGFDYRMLRLGRGSFASGDGDASVLDTPGGTVQRLGGTVRFSTLAGYAEGARVLPLDASMTYSTDLTGITGTPDRTKLTIEGRVFHRFWGGR